MQVPVKVQVAEESSDPSERGLVLENGVRAIFWPFLINSKKPINWTVRQEDRS